MKKTMVIGITIVILAIAATCIYLATMPNPVDEFSLRISSDPMTEQLLMAINDGNYSQFTMNFDQAMLSSFQYVNFTQLRDLFQSKIVNYTSKDFLKGESVGDFIIAYYIANYSNEPANVTVKVVFSSNNGPAKITGLWFYSPKLNA